MVNFPVVGVKRLALRVANLEDMKISVEYISKLARLSVSEKGSGGF